MLLDIGAENIELAPGSFHIGSEGVDKSGCRQLRNAVNRGSRRAAGGWPDRLRNGQPQVAGSSCHSPLSCLEAWFSSRDSTFALRESPFSCCRTGVSCWKPGRASRESQRFCSPATIPLSANRFERGQVAPVKDVFACRHSLMREAILSLRVCCLAIRTHGVAGELDAGEQPEAVSKVLNGSVNGLVLCFCLCADGVSCPRGIDVTEPRRILEVLSHGAGR